MGGFGCRQPPWGGDRRQAVSVAGWLGTADLTIARRVGRAVGATKTSTRDLVEPWPEPRAKPTCDGTAGVANPMAVPLGEPPTRLESSQIGRESGYQQGLGGAGVRVCSAGHSPLTSRGGRTRYSRSPTPSRPTASTKSRAKQELARDYWCPESNLEICEVLLLGGMNLVKRIEPTRLVDDDLA